MIILDTNVILRYLLNDIPAMYKIAADHIKNEECTVYPEVIAEAVYVLTSVYKIPRNEVSKVLIDFMSEVECTKKEAVITCLQLFSETRLDFVDCLLIAYNICNGYKVLTFDKKMLKRLT